MTLKLRPFDPVRYLDTDEAVDIYLADACESGNVQEMAHALGVVARAKGIADLSRQTGLSRQAIYKALSGEGNPELATVAKVADALGYKLSLVAKTPEEAA